MTWLQRRSFWIVLALFALASPPSLQAQDYPSKTITIVVGLAPGTGMDIIARLYGEQLSQRFGRPVIVENRPGGGFIAATQTVTSAPADGHTLLVGAPSNVAYNHLLYKQLPYDPEKDLVPISHYLTSPFILVVNPSMPVHSAKEFIDYAKSQPAPLSYGTPAGIGVPGFAVEEMARRFGLRFNHVPYRSSPQAILDVSTGHIQFSFAEAGASQALIRDGKLRALAVSSKQRLPAHPSIPPFAEAANAPDYEVVAWHMLVARTGTPKPILERLNAEMKQIMGAPEMRQRIANMGLLPIDPPSLDETDRYIKSETAKFGVLLKALGLAGTQ
jgi:tripartite-type tricarboxylate transporter receptor subunit TctC